MELFVIALEGITTVHAKHSDWMQNFCAWVLFISYCMLCSFDPYERGSNNIVNNTFLRWSNSNCTFL